MLYFLPDLFLTFPYWKWGASFQSNSQYCRGKVPAAVITTGWVPRFLGTAWFVHARACTRL